MLAAVSTLHRNAYKYVEARLGLVWHKKLTNILHKDYFHEMVCINRIFSPIKTPPSSPVPLLPPLRHACCCATA